MLIPDPEVTEEGIDHDPREVVSGHYVPVKPTPIVDPSYVAHSRQFLPSLAWRTI